MKPKNTLILLIVAIGLFAFIQFYESKYTKPTAWKEHENSQVVIFDEAAVDGISITSNEDKIELRKEDTTWKVLLPGKGGSPGKDHADITLVNQLLGDLEDLKAIDSFEADGKSADTPTLKELGLETSSLRVKLLSKGAPVEILFGKDAPVEGQMYVRIDGTNRVSVASNAVKAEIQKTTDDFRARRLIDFSPDLVTRLDVKSPAGEIEVLKDRGVWSVNKPLKARGDAQKISDLIAQTINSHIDTFLPEDGANLATYGLAEPRGSISLSVEGSDKPVVLEIGQPAENDKQKVYAKLSTRESIYILPEKINDVLFIKPNDVRDKHLLELNLDMVDRIHIEAPGKPKVTIARKDEDWILKSFGDLPANDTLVKNFVNYLRVLKINAFVSDVATDLPKYGLDKPQLRVTFSAYASENTAETMAGESPILTLAFGKVEDKVVYARLENEPYVVSVPKALFDAISPDPVMWMDLSIFQYKPEEIVSLTILRDDQVIELECDDKGVWKLKNATGDLNQNSVQSLLNTLATLHAVSSLGSSTTGMGFEKPQLTINFTTSGKKTGKLNIGTPNSESMWNAEAEARPGAFLVSKPDYEALHADLAAPAAPTAPPSPVDSPSGAPAGVH